MNKAIIAKGKDRGCIAHDSLFWVSLKHLKPHRGFGDLGRMVIYFQQDGEHCYQFSGSWGTSS